MRFCGHSSFSRIDAFTERGRNPLSMVATGWGNQRISEPFEISRSAVKYRLKNLCDKLVSDDWTVSVTFVRSERRFQR
jgi:DNA-binding NarL/FixJ family response regulator